MKIPDLILHNFRLKLMSVLIAVLAWEAIHLATQRESEASRPATSPGTNEFSR